MPMEYRKDILSALKEKGFTTYRLRKEGLLAESTIQHLRRGEPLSWENISRIIDMLECEPGDILMRVSKED